MNFILIILREKLIEKNVKIRIFGELSLLPLDLRELLDEVQLLTDSHTG